MKLICVAFLFLLEEPEGTTTDLHGQMEVPLDQLLVVPGPVADGVVHLEHARVSAQQQRRPARLQPGPEGSPVHPLPEVELLRDDADRLVLSEVLAGEEVLFEEQPGTLDVLLLVLPDLCRRSWRTAGGRRRKREKQEDEASFRR